MKGLDSPVSESLERYKHIKKKLSLGDNYKFWNNLCDIGKLYYYYINKKKKYVIKIKYMML